MYKNFAAIAIKHNGKILRELKDLVLLPYGSEYSILIKNLNSRRMQAQVSIDGTDIGDGTTFIIDANSDIELKRFVRNGNLDEGNAFKFIERTAGIEEHRGIKMEDGIVRVEFQFEKEVIRHDAVHIYHGSYWPYGYPHYRSPHWYGTLGGTYYGSGVANGSTFSATAVGSTTDATALRGMITNAVATGANSSVSGESASINTVYTAQAIPKSVPANDAGITVPGSKVEQQFKVVTNFNAETDLHVLILRLAGETADNKPVEKAVTVKTKSKCVTCGKTNKGTASFCSSCGTAVQLI
jgi:hypothetical protein